MFGFRKHKGQTDAVKLKARLDTVELHLRAMGYELTPHGVGLALIELESGYSEAETASHVALMTLARDVRSVGTNIIELMSFLPHATHLLEIIKSHKDQGLMHPTQWQNDANAIWHVVNVDEHQQEWIERVLSDPVAGEERLATRHDDSFSS